MQVGQLLDLECALFGSDLSQPRPEQVQVLVMLEDGVRDMLREFKGALQGLLKVAREELQFLGQGGALHLGLLVGLAVGKPEGHQGHHCNL